MWFMKKPTADYAAITFYCVEIQATNFSCNAVEVATQQNAVPFNTPFNDHSMVY
jgi:hypothetical protein